MFDYFHLKRSQTTVYVSVFVCVCWLRACVEKWKCDLGHNCIEILSNNKATPRIGGKKIKLKEKEKKNRTKQK